ncbi:MAG: hypothetical protein K6T30_10450, partial [Alicyclobacillus sp.]|nr:hypothetical protein [Alicyclobacillus sp.]
SEKHYLGASSTPAYTIEYTYDDWANLTSRKNSASGLEEYFTYVNTNAESLPAEIAGLPGVQPLPYRNSVAANIHNLCTGAVSIWRRDGVVLAVRQEAKEYAEDGSLRRRAGWDAGRNEWIVTVYETDPYGNITAVHEPEGKTTRFVYDANHAYLVEKKIEGVYDADGKPLPPVVTRYGYYPLGEKKYEIDPRGYVTTYKYDLLGRLVEICYPAMDEAPLADPAAYTYAERPGNPRRQYIYRDDLDITEVVNEEGVTSKFYYDGLGHLIRVERFRKGETNPAIAIEFTYDERFNVVGLKEANGNYTSYGYDPYGRLVRVVLPRDASDTFSGNPKATVAYDDAAQTKTITDPSGRQRIEYYDALGRLVRVVLAPGKPEEIAVLYEYNGFGERIRERDPGGGETSYRHDSLGRLVEMLLPAVEVWDHTTGRGQRMNPRITYTYDGLGHKSSETNANGVATLYRYDVLGRLLAVIETYTENGEKKTRTSKTYYDPAGNVVATVDGNGNTVTYEYYPRGWLKAESRAHLDETDLRRTEYTYDNLGRRTSITDPRGTATSIPDDFTTLFVYDDFGRLVRTVFPDETPGTWADNPREETGYDPNGNPIWKKDPNGNVTRTYYNARNLPYRVVDPLGNETLTTYGPAGERLAVRDPSGRATSFAYDGLGQLIRVIDPAGNTTEYTYDRNGNRTGVRDANGNTTNYGYECAEQGRITQEVGSLPGKD